MKVFNPIQDMQYIELSTNKKENEMLVLSKYKKEIEKIKTEINTEQTTEIEASIEISTENSVVRK